MKLAKSKLVKIIILGVVLIAASWFFAHMCHQFGQLGDDIFSPSTGILHLFIRLLVALMLVAITAGLVSVLIRPLWISVAIFALASIAILFGLGRDIFGIILALVYLLAGFLYCRGVARGIEERIKFSLRPLYDNQMSLFIILAIMVLVSFYHGYASQIEGEGFRVPSFVTDVAVGIAGEQPGDGTGIYPEEEGTSDLREEFEEQVAEWVEPFQQYIPIGVAVIMFAPLVIIFTMLSWIPPLVLKGLFRLLKAVHVIDEVAEMQEIKRLVIS